MNLTHADIADIIKLMDSSPLDEIVVEAGGLRIEARRRGAVVERTPIADVRANVGAALRTASQPVVVAAAAPTAAAEIREVQSGSLMQSPQIAPGHLVVNSPMVGTFYRCPSPDAPPFVAVGSKIAVGDALCLVEVMKLFTTVSASAAGTVVQICAENSDLVEFDQVLFVIDPD